MRMDPNEIVRRLKENGFRVRQTARELGVSHSTVSRWWRRAKTGLRRVRHSGLVRRSTRPRRARATQLPAPVQDAVSRLRHERGFCASKLVGLLGLDCHPRTVHRFLLGKGLVEEQTRYRRPRFQETRHMHARNATQPGKLQMDVKYVTPELSGLVHTSYLYAVMDIWSRWKAALILPLLDQGSAIQAVRAMFPTLPLTPDFIQTDNGLEFQAQFHQVVTSEYGLDHHYIHKSNPNENAVIERSFRTDQDEFFFWELTKLGRAPRNLDELNRLYQDWLTMYNTYRPHLSLELMTPQEKLHSLQVA